MFLIVIHFHTGLIFLGKAGSVTIRVESHEKLHFVKLKSCLREVNGSGKRSSLLRKQ